MNSRVATFNYNAPDPYQESFFSSLFSFSSSKRIGKMVLPAQWLEPKTIDMPSLEHFAYNNALVIHGGHIATHDEAVIDTIELKPLSQVNNPISNQDYIIKYNGNYMLYQDKLYDFANDALALDA